MKHRLCIFGILILLSNLTLFGQEKRALLIGIGQYAQDTGWHSIHGDNDVAITESILLRNGFEAKNIKTLVNEKATFAAINEAFIDLLDVAENKDIIYIQFSGHGQQITDLDGDEEDELDECWIPFDACQSYHTGVYEGQCHFTDDRLFGYLSRLRKIIGPSGKIVVISDACHSGSGSRGNDDDDIIRGTDKKFLIPNVHPLKRLRRSPEEHVQWLFVAACKSYQTNYEHRLPNGDYCGSLTYVISQDSNDFISTPYTTLINGWKGALQDISRFPQSIDEEGSPNRKSQFLF